MSDPEWLASSPTNGSSSTPTACSRQHSSGGSSFKVILIGDAGVGKTSLLFRLRHPDVAIGKESISSTIGVDTFTHAFPTRYGKVSLTIWDTAGVERFRTLTRNYYRNTHAALLVFGVDDKATLFSLPRWQKDISESAPSAIQFLVANKCDLNPEVSEGSMRSFADSHNCQAAFLTSAKTGEGVEEALSKTCERLVEHYKTHRVAHQSDQLWQQGSGLHVHGAQEQPASKCCP